MTELSIRERVKAGAELLDEKKPDWWKPDRINLDWLNLCDPCDCIGGQLFDDFDEFLFEMLAGDINSAAALGFTYSVPYDSRTMPYVEFHRLVNTDLEALDDEWRRVINDRRAADGEQVDVVVLG